MPRFVVLRHETSQGTHFDLMLEVGKVLRTWSFAEPPQPGVEAECRELADHRLAYLDYEGPISGGRGNVSPSDRGVYTMKQEHDAEIVIEFAGQRLVGEATLRRSSGDSVRWQFLPH